MARPKIQNVQPEKDPLWYKSAVIYEVPVRAFFDSNADGIGDFKGLIDKLDYVQELGVTALWLLPFYPSPLKDDGYDIADYFSINPIYGTLRDFKRLLREAHARGLRVITELVLNHTSDQHLWFQQSRRAKPGSRERELYVWSDTPEKYRDARIIFKDFEPSNWTWDPIARSYYWHRFYSHQPDLNFDSPHVHDRMRDVLDFWLDMGVDGFRLDAVPYLYEREGTSCENLPETHDYLKKLRSHVDEKYGERMLLAEANQWPEEAVTYYGSGKGDECHMAFHFPLMPRLFMAVRMEDRIPIVDIVEQTPAIPEMSQWALFLRNHDELTLEMVTDEERDYMYRVYASDSKARLNLGIRRRLAPLLNNDRKRVELLNLLLLSLPGTPVLYYGDELGMGDNIFLGDRNGVRTPMQWSADKNAGFSRATPQALYAPIILDPEYHYEAVNVEVQQRNPHALLWWTRRVLALRKRWKVFGLGSLEFLQPENRKVLAFFRRHENETVLVVANLSRFPQPVELDLTPFAGHTPIELFGGTKFPAIGPGRYPLTLSPHAAFWFSLQPLSARESGMVSPRMCETLGPARTWEELLTGPSRARFEACLPGHLRRQRWFSTDTEIKSARIHDTLVLPQGSGKRILAMVAVDYLQREPEEYLLPLALATGSEAARVEREFPHAILARLSARKRGVGGGIIYDATVNASVTAAILDIIGRRRMLKGREGSLQMTSTPALRAIRNRAALKPSRIKSDERNTSIVFGDRFVLKLFRHLEPGINPELECAEFLTAKQFPHVPTLAGALEYERTGNERICLGILSAFIPNARNAWTFTLDALRRYFDRVRTLPADARPTIGEGAALLDRAENEIPARVAEVVGTYLEAARLLGQRTGELHLALASDAENPDFAPESFTPFYQRSLYQSLRNHLLQRFQLMRRQAKSVPGRARPLAEKVLGLQDTILRRYRAVYENHFNALRIRCHGDYHLNELLHTGKDFVVIDFEGEPWRAMTERRIKRSPLRDVASMIRSFDYAANAALTHQLEAGNLRHEQVRSLEPWTRLWLQWVSAAFLGGYLAVTRQSPLLPRSKAALALLLEVLVLDKAVAEVGHELTNRPELLHVPLQGILQIMNEKPVPLESTASR